MVQSPARRGVRAVEGARLESVCTLIAYRGFESLSLRTILKIAPAGLFLVLNGEGFEPDQKGFDKSANKSRFGRRLVKTAPEGRVPEVRVNPSLSDIRLR